MALHLPVSPPIARRPNLLEEPHGTQLRILGQPHLDDLLVGIELRGPPTPRSVPDRLVVQLPVQLPRGDPPVQRPFADLRPPRDGGLAQSPAPDSAAAAPASLSRSSRLLRSVETLSCRSAENPRRCPLPAPRPYPPQLPKTCRFRRPVLCNFAWPVTAGGPIHQGRVVGDDSGQGLARDDIFPVVAQRAAWAARGNAEAFSSAGNFGSESPRPYADMPGRHTWATSPTLAGRPCRPVHR